MDIKAAEIGGNVGDEKKQSVMDLLTMLTQAPLFACQIGQRIRLTNIDIAQREDEPQKVVTKVIAEVTVKEGMAIMLYLILVTDIDHLDMLNGAGVMQGGCTAYLMDMWVAKELSTGFLTQNLPFSLSILPLAAAPNIKHPILALSQNLSITYHSPAPLYV